jgi:FKBP-type peptidyl-prolyl cis-trans isomerase FkpA
VAGDTVRSSTSTLKYLNIQAGTGTATVAAGSTVSFHYTGYLTDGTRFESSRDRGQPFIARPNQLIPGFAEGLLGMKVGSSRRLIVPPALGYGVGGSFPCIPGNATLIFDVEVLSIS